MKDKDTKLLEEAYGNINKEDILEEDIFGSGAWDIAQGIFLYDAISTGAFIALGAAIIGGLALKNKIISFAQDTAEKLRQRKYLNKVLKPAYERLMQDPEIEELSTQVQSLAEPRLKQDRPELFTKRGDVRVARSDEYKGLVKDRRAMKRKLDELIETNLSEEEQTAFSDLKKLVLGTSVQDM